jgi:ABC-type bacteriocin/lantibiotic exporter with double-glycine peptidase domain
MVEMRGPELRIAKKCGSSADRRLGVTVAHVRQTRGMCGPASLQIVLSYFGKPISAHTIAKACRSSVVSGTTGTNLAQGARRLGFGVRIFDCSSFRAIETWLRRRVPVIVDWMSTARSSPRSKPLACGHYSVVYGIGKKHIALADPALGGGRRMPRNVFRNVWFDFKYVFPQRNDDLILRRMIVVVPDECWFRSGRTQRRFI